jgi:protein tyrosine/serine phosphatase
MAAQVHSLRAEGPVFKVSALSVAFCTLLLLFVAAQASPVLGSANDKNKDKGRSSEDITIKNFGKVNDHLFRGGQPEGDQYKQLAAKGVKTVVDLRNDAVGKARSWAEDAGMKYINLRMDARIPPTSEESKQFLDIVNDQANWPIYVHCAGGRHRTGVLVAVYRMEIDGWDAEKAFGEMKDFKFYSSFGHGDMKDYVFGYYRKMTELRAQNPASPAARPRRITDGND